tara:strand:- start:860 stop:1132 length:273 start_codon:yes stop_codon:yes gene_type:complete
LFPKGVLVFSLYDEPLQHTIVPMVLHGESRIAAVVVPNRFLAKTCRHPGFAAFLRSDPSVSRFSLTVGTCVLFPSIHRCVGEHLRGLGMP